MLISISTKVRIYLLGQCPETSFFKLKRTDIPWNLKKNIYFTKKTLDLPKNDMRVTAVPSQELKSATNMSSSAGTSTTNLSLLPAAKTSLDQSNLSLACAVVPEERAPILSLEQIKSLMSLKVKIFNIH